MAHRNIPNVTAPVERERWGDLPPITSKVCYRIKLLVRDQAEGILREQELRHIYPDVGSANEAAMSIQRIHYSTGPGGEVKDDVGVHGLRPGETRQFSINGRSLILTFADNVLYYDWYVREDTGDGPGQILYQVKVVSSFYRGQVHF